MTSLRSRKGKEKGNEEYRRDKLKEDCLNNPGLKLLHISVLPEAILMESFPGELFFEFKQINESLFSPISTLLSVTPNPFPIIIIVHSIVHNFSSNLIHPSFGPSVIYALIFVHPSLLPRPPFECPRWRHIPLPKCPYSSLLFIFQFQAAP